jgi:hypothetical protein
VIFISPLPFLPTINRRRRLKTPPERLASNHNHRPLALLPFRLARPSRTKVAQRVLYFPGVSAHVAFTPDSTLSCKSPMLSSATTRFPYIPIVDSIFNYPFLRLPLIGDVAFLFNPSSTSWPARPACVSSLASVPLLAFSPSKIQRSGDHISSILKPVCSTKTSFSLRFRPLVPQSPLILHTLCYKGCSAPVPKFNLHGKLLNE